MGRRKIESTKNNTGFVNVNRLTNYREKGVVVEGSNAKAWFNVNGVRFLYKEYDDVLPCFGEVLYYRAAKMCDIDCAEYDFATLNGKFGTISYDFLRENEAYYNCLELTTQFGESSFDLENIATNHELLIIQNNKYNNLSSIRSLLGRLFHASSEQKRDIEINLIKMYVLDTLFWHLDRTLWNYGVIINEETDEVRFAPIHDNSYVLSLNKGEKFIEEAIVEFINGGVMRTERSASSFNLMFDGDNSIDQLISFYENCDENMRKEITDIIDKMDVDTLVKSTMEDCQIGDVPALWVKAILNFRKKTILRGLESVRISDEGAQLPNITFSRRK